MVPTSTYYHNLLNSSVGRSFLASRKKVRDVKLWLRFNHVWIGRKWFYLFVPQVNAEVSASFDEVKISSERILHTAVWRNPKSDKNYLCVIMPLKF